MQDQDEKHERLKRELQRTQGQIHTFIHGGNDNGGVAGSGRGGRGPRPASFVSVEESSGGEQVSTTTSDVDRVHESDDEGKG